MSDNTKISFDIDMSERSGADTIGVALPADETNPANSGEGQQILDAALRVCETVLGPNAQVADQADGPMRENFKALADAGLLGLAIPRKYGGLDASGTIQRRYTEILSSYCGVTTFVQAQHHGSSRMIANGRDELLKDTLLPRLASGDRMCAISFAHLRRPGPPILRAERVAGGCRLYGTAPWVTGWGLMDQAVFGATLPDDRFLYVWTPANRSDYPELFRGDQPDNGGWGDMEATAPLPLCTMNASATVALHLDGWFIPERHILSESDRATMRNNDRNGVLGATAMPLGCAEAGLRILCDTAEKKKLFPIERAANSFAAELHELRGLLERWSEPGRTAQPDFFENAVQLRAWCIELALRTAHASITAVSGSANSLNHPAQRLIRESMFYTVQAQTAEVMDATLARLER